ncbi:type IVB secretion system protein IcmN/DotK [Legionella cardiaca]|uniref:Type IVB secretion system protein IcmN/DotK n=1 Tax=Legionella cardiaca TaxID=1071983 RepID=A0ABY8ASI0_9GAMM|nr:type IVB secretion system protein IcmN/DotK [Legionella cardiaca]WED43623.1 type IVB secretion system protein IcmN/DotK [Legionella cardiaca]
MRQLRVGLLGFSTWHATLLASLLLLGCSKVRWMPPYEGPGLPQKVEGTSDNAVPKLQKKLARCGVSVITIGSDYLVSIPSAALFADQSPRLTWPSYGLLNNVVAFLKQFRKVAITVTTYSNKYVSAKREHALTLARSRAVADYLWSQGIDSRFIFTVGAGSDKPIMAYAQGGDKSPNSRVEITFRDAII